MTSPRFAIRVDHRPRALVALLAAIATLHPTVARAQAEPRKVTLRNCLDPALLTRHEMTITLRRLAERAGAKEESELSVRSEFVRAHMDESQPGQVKVADMVITDAAKVKFVKRDGKEVTRPGPETFNMPPRGSAQLKTQVQTTWDGPVPRPHLRPVDESVMGVLLDVLHWPKKSVEIGHTWTRPVDTGEFRGTQTYTIDSASKIGDDPVAIGRVIVTGGFTGRLSETYKFDEAALKFVFSRRDRVMIRMDGAALFKRVTDEGDEPHRVDFINVLKSRERVDHDGQAMLIDSLTDFALASTEFQTGRMDKAIAACAAFRKKWTSSPWQPAVAFIEDQALRQSRPVEKLNDDDLMRSLAELIVRWDAAIQAEDVDLQARTRRSFQGLLEVHRDQINAMMRETDEHLRAVAVFVWSFGESPAHFAQVAQALNDKSARVREWAANGLAARAEPYTDPDILRRILADAEPGVRARGCLAISRCLQPGEPLAGRLREFMLERLKNDDAAIVRIAAAEAFGRVGTPSDVTPLTDAAAADPDAGAQKAMQTAIDRIKRR